MNIANTAAISLKAIMLNKRRSFLTMLGIIIGVGSVVLLTSLGTGLQSTVEKSFSDLGSNVLFVVPGDPFSGGGGGQESFIDNLKPVLKQQQLDRILRKNREIITSGATTAFDRAEAKYGNVTKRATIYGVSPSYEVVRNTLAEVGQWYDENDDRQSRRVVMLGPEIARELFGKVDPINKKIKLAGQSYTVVGILESKGGGFGGPNFDNYVYVPITTFFDNFTVEVIDSFVFRLRSKEDIPAAKAAIEQVLLEDLKDDEFTVFDQSELLKTINNILGILTAGLGGISAISLVVGGIGIMNIMLVSVTERTREIGLRKALGATPNTILAQFLIEAALLSTIGGMIGVGIAYLGTLAIQQFFPARVLPESILLAFTVSAVVGIIFGSAPARSAAKLSPIEALRSE